MTDVVARARSVWLDEESTYSTEADSSGAGYSWLRVLNKPFPVNARKTEDLDSATGRNEPGEVIVTQAGAQLDLETPAIGYATASGDGAAAPTADVLDYLLANGLCQAYGSFGGEGVSTGSVVSNAILDASITALNDGMLAPFLISAESRVKWRAILSAASEPTYTIQPDMDSALVTADILQGARVYGQANQLTSQGPSLSSIVSVDQRLHLLTGGRVTALSLMADAGKNARFKASLMFDDWSHGVTRASLPTATVGPTPAKMMLSSVLWGATDIECASVEIDFGISAGVVDSTRWTNGRAGHVITSIDPVIKLTPYYAPTQWADDFEAGTTRTILIQIGSGALASGRSNSLAFWGLRAQVVKVTDAERNGMLAHQIELKVLGSASDGLVRWGFARC